MAYESYFNNSSFSYKATVKSLDSGQTFCCPGSLLAAESSVFHDILSSDNPEIVVSDTKLQENFCIVKDAFCFMMGGNIDISLQNLELLMLFSSIYDIQRLQEACNTWLEDNLSYRNVFRMFEMTNNLAATSQQLYRITIFEFVSESSEEVCGELIDRITLSEQVPFAFIDMMLELVPPRCGDLLRIIADNSPSTSAPSLIDELIANLDRVNFSDIYGDEETFKEFISSILPHISCGETMHKILNAQQHFYNNLRIITDDISIRNSESSSEEENELEDELFCGEDQGNSSSSSKRLSRVTPSAEKTAYNTSEVRAKPRRRRHIGRKNQNKATKNNFQSSYVNKNFPRSDLNQISRKEKSEHFESVDDDPKKDYFKIDKKDYKGQNFQPFGQYSQRGGNTNRRGGKFKSGERGGRSQSNQRGGINKSTERGGHSQSNQRGGGTKFVERGGHSQSNQKGGNTKFVERGGHSQSNQRGGNTKFTERGGHSQSDQRCGKNKNVERGGRSNQRGGKDKHLVRGGQPPNTTLSNNSWSSEVNINIQTTETLQTAIAKEVGKLAIHCVDKYLANK